MADKKITELTNITGVNLVDADEFVVVDISADETKAITLGELKNAFDTGSGFVRITGDTMTGDLALSGADVTFGDNDKAIFGAGSDLRIYHDGSDSYIRDTGIGDLYLAGSNNIYLTDVSFNPIIRLEDTGTGGIVHLYNEGSVKLATTATGVDITGTLTSDSLTVDGEGIISSTTTATNLSDPILQLSGSSYTPYGVYGMGFHYQTESSGTSPVFAGYQITSGSGNTKGNLVFGTRDTTTSGDVPLIRQTIAPNGDINFYASDGTTPAFHWDAADERLGIGTSSPSAALDVSTGGSTKAAIFDGNGVEITHPTLPSNLFLGTQTGSDVKIASVGAYPMLFHTNGSEAMRIDNSGNVGIGITPSAWGGDQTPIQVGASALSHYGIAGSGSTYLSNNYFYDGATKAIFYGYTSDYYQSGANHIWRSSGITSAGATASLTERMRIDSSGNVGIGVSDPSTWSLGKALHIGNKENNLWGEADYAFHMNQNAYYNSGWKYSHTDEATQYTQADGQHIWSYAGSGSANAALTWSEAMRIDSSGNLSIGSADDNPFNWGGSSNNVSITASGANDWAQLSLKGNGTGGTGINLGSGSVRHAGIFSLDGSTLAFTTNATNSGTGTTTRMQIESNGNVGIGVVPEASYATSLSIKYGGNNITSRGNADFRIMSGAFQDGASTFQYSVSSLPVAMLSMTNGAFGFATAPAGTDGGAASFSNSMTLDASGNLLVGGASTDPIANNTNSTQIAADGYININRANNNSFYIGRSGSDGQAVLFYKGTTSVGSISLTGSSTAYNTSSDYRLKTDAQPMTGASARVQALNPVNFEWLSDGTRVDGFLAHEAQAIVPEAVTGTKDAMMDEEYEVTPAVLDDDGNEVTPAVMGTRSVPDMQGIDQSKIVPLLTAALQEALTEITALKARVTALEG